MQIEPLKAGQSDRQKLPKLALILCLALVLRIGLFTLAWHNSPDLSNLHSPDTHTYILPAESLLLHGTFSQDGVPELSRTPGYPVFLMLGILTGHLEIVTVVLQMLLSVATVWLVYRLASQLTGSQAAAACAGLFAAVEPLSIIYTCYLLPETVYTFLLILSLISLVRYVHSSQLSDATISGLLLAMATLVRPVSYYLTVGLVFILLIRALWETEARLRKVACAGVFGLMAFAPLAAWQVRNYSVTEYAGFSAIAEKNLYFYQAASVLAQQSGKPLEEVQAELGYFDQEVFDRRHPELRNASQAAILGYLDTAGSRIIRNHIFQYARIHLRGLVILTLNPATSDALRLLHLYPENQNRLRPIELGIFGSMRQMQKESPLVFYSSLSLAGIFGLLYLASLLGILAIFRQLSWQWTILASTACYFLGVSGGADLRSPASPSGDAFGLHFGWNGHRMVISTVETPPFVLFLAGYHPTDINKQTVPSGLA